MFKSMTGFGRGEYFDRDHRFTVEIRAVNHRFNDIVLRIPKTLGGLEDRTRKSIAGTLARGRIDVVVTADSNFPYGLPVGVVRDVSISKDNLFEEATINFSYDINSIETVLIEK